MNTGYNFFDYKNKGMMDQQQMQGPTDPYNQPMDNPGEQPYGMMAPQDMGEPYGGSSILPPGLLDPIQTGEMDTSMFPEEDSSPLPNFDKYMDGGRAAGQQYQDVSNAGMGMAQMKAMTQRGQPQYQDFMGGGSGYQGLPYGLLGR
jgi:hypothetical protein